MSPPPPQNSIFLGDHIQVTDISIQFPSDFNPSNELLVHVNHERKVVVLEHRSRQRSMRWNCSQNLQVWPNSSLSVQPSRQRRLLSKERCEPVHVSAEELFLACDGVVDQRLEHEIRGDIFQMTLGIKLIPFSTASTVMATPTQRFSSALDVFGSSYTCLTVLMGVIQGISSIHPVAEAAMIALAGVYQLLQNQKNFNDDLRRHGVEMHRILARLHEVRDHARLAGVHHSIIEIMKVTRESSDFIREYLNRSALDRMLASQFRSTLDDYRARFQLAGKNFENAMLVQTVVVTDQIATDAVLAQEERILGKLKPVRWGWVSKCLKGTREDALEKIYEWANDSATSNVLWVSGSPGAGKSTIVSTVVTELSERKRLVSSFFFKRGDASLGNPTSLWRTVAFDFARFHPSLKEDIIDVLTADTFGLDRVDIELHFKYLIETPLKKHQNIFIQNPVVVVLDALDECGLEGSWQRKLLLNTLNSWSYLSPGVKLIVASRDERDIHKFLHGISERVALLTGELVQPRSSDDIRLFLRSRFGEIAEEYSDVLEPTWPGDKIIERLTTSAAGLFIWADTVTKFVRKGIPNRQLNAILTGTEGVVHIDSLYQKILDLSFDEADVDTLEAFRTVVSSVILAKRPLSRDCLRNILRGTGMDPMSVDFVLNRLSAVISTRESDGLLRISHQSFADFLTDAHRCPERYHISREEHSYRMVKSCLWLMNDELKFNISGWETSHVCSDAVANLATHVDATIPSHLTYSCLFWAQHLHDAGKKTLESLDLLPDIEMFLRQRLLFWLEVLSVIGEVSSAVPALASAARRIKELDGGLSKLAVDASRFIINFREPISQSVPHIYLSALPFAPSTSKVAEVFLPHHPNTLSVVGGRKTLWPALRNVLEGHTERVSAVVYSPDGKQIVSCSFDKTIRVWDAEKGTTVSGPFDGHADAINSLAFSPTGRYVASGSRDMTVRIWDIENGSAVFDPFEGHTDAVNSVSFSHDGKYVASGSWDGTIRVWDINRRSSVSEPFTGHTDSVFSVSFSPNGRYVASGSRDNTIRIWNAARGVESTKPLIGHKDSVFAVAYSPDGRFVVSGSADNEIRVWNAKTGTTAAGPFKGHKNPVMSVAFSHDGKYIVSGSMDKTARVWEAEKGALVAGPFIGHNDYVYSTSFSPDGRYVISSSKDKTIRIWDADKSTTDEGIVDRHIDAVYSVAYSPCGNYVVSGSRDKTIRVWAHENGAAVSGPFIGHTNHVSSVALSPDGEYIVSGAYDKTIRIWRTDGGAAVAEMCGHSDTVESVAFSPDGRYVVSGSSDQTILVWNFSERTIALGPLTGHEGLITSVAFSPTESHVVSASMDGTIRIWDIDTGAEMCEPFRGHHGAVYSAAFSPDGKYIASGSKDKTILIWDAECGSPVLAPLVGHIDSVFCVRFSPTGEFIASSSRDKTVRIWDAKKGTLVAGPFRGHTHQVTSVAFSPDGTHLVSGSWDLSVRIWSVKDIIEKSDVDQRDGFTDGSTMIDGWMYGESSERLFWVPPSNRDGLYWPRNTAVLSVPSSTVLDMKNFVHGLEWEDCQ